MRRYKIGEVAKLLGLTTQALRFYEQEGIVTPYKSENGTRYFTEPDIVRLMAFKRFRLMNFTVQDVAEHFGQGDLLLLVDKMEKRREELLEQSRVLLRRAQAIERFEKMLCLVEERENELICVERPDIYMHGCTLAELDRLRDDQREAFDRFINAMPDAHICFVYDPGKKEKPQFRFAITKSNAEAWNVPLKDTMCFAGGKCVRLFLRTNEMLWNPEFLDAQVARVAAAGYTVDCGEPIIGQQLASENMKKKKGLLIAALYIPIK